MISQPYPEIRWAKLFTPTVGNPVVWTCLKIIIRLFVRQLNPAPVDLSHVCLIPTQTTFPTAIDNEEDTMSE